MHGLDQMSLSEIWPIGALLLVLGACLGSFIAAMVDRYPFEFSDMLRPSRCNSCCARISWPLLIPIFGFVAASGSCKNCGARIPRHLLLVEVAGMFLGLGGFSLLFRGAEASAHFFLISNLLLFVALLDLKHWIIPYFLTIPIWFIGIYFASKGPLGPMRAVLTSVLVFAICLGFGWISTRIFQAIGNLPESEKAFGIGDAYLMGGIAANVHWRYLPPILVLASCQGLLVYFALTRLKKVEFSTGEGPDGFKPPAGAVPFGAFLALSTMEIGLIAF